MTAVQKPPFAKTFDVRAREKSAAAIGRYPAGKEH
jgi:hypothetical protein